MVEPIPTLKKRLGGRSLYLVGMMGSGKTSTGRPLAEQLGYGFVDADAVIEQAAGCSIAEIFENDGETGFRTLERQVLSAISQRHSLVVATGGGVVTQQENWGYLHSGIVIWLNVNHASLVDRLRTERESRPLLDQPDWDSELEMLLHQRRPLYAEADLTIEIRNETPEELTNMIFKLLPDRLSAPRKSAT